MSWAAFVTDIPSGMTSALIRVPGCGTSVGADMADLRTNYLGGNGPCTNIGSDGMYLVALHNTIGVLPSAVKVGIWRGGIARWGKISRVKNLKSVRTAGIIALVKTRIPSVTQPGDGLAHPN